MNVNTTPRVTAHSNCEHAATKVERAKCRRATAKINDAHAASRELRDAQREFAEMMESVLNGDDE